MVASVEYAHIYTDQKFTGQHEKGINILKEWLAEVPSRKTHKVILIDDYSSPISFANFDFSNFLNELRLRSAAPDTVILESALVPYCQKTLELVTDKKVRKDLTHYIRTRQKYPCSLFVASWYLMRLGAFGKPNIASVIGDATDLLADELVTILPESFVSPEAYALRIIRATEFSGYAEKINKIFFKHADALYSTWEEFNPVEYVERNYGNAILHEDRTIIYKVVSELRNLGVGHGSLKNVADIGTGPNFYPALLMSPLLHDEATLHLIDFSPSNLSFLRNTIKGKQAGNDTWQKFYRYMHELDWAADTAKIRSLAEVKKGSIYTLKKHAYDMVSSFFVAESITDKKDMYIAALDSLMNSLKPGGIYVTAHMVGSDGYFAGERTSFPAVNLSQDDIKQSYAGYGQHRIHFVSHDDQKAARQGYSGMAVVVGIKA